MAQCKSQFPLFQTPLDLAHGWWKKLLEPKDSAIDATCGNGHDTLFLAEHLKEGRVIAIDYQPQAIEATRQRLAGLYPQVEFYVRCHSSFPKHILLGSVALIVYNLGYLPGGDKTLTTARCTTLKSLQAALPLVRQGGAISVTCYPGHKEGKFEEEAVLQFAAELDPKRWSCCHHRWANRKTGPTWLLIQQCR